MAKKDVKKKKLQNFKQKAKKMAAQAKEPKTHLIPNTEWQSNDILDLRGDILEALEKTLIQTFEDIQRINQNFNNIGRVMQLILSSNIKAGKVKLGYKWNNGEEATAADIAVYESQMAEVAAQQKQQVTEAINANKVNENSLKTGLVDENGSPIGTDQSLDEDEKTED